MLRRILLTPVVVALTVILFVAFFQKSKNLSRAAAVDKDAIVADVFTVQQPVNTRAERLLLAGSTGETVVSITTAAADGPVVMVLGGIHGDEPAGYRAAVEIASWVIDRGTLVVIPRANVTAIEREQRCGADGLDLNRSFPGDEAGSLSRQLAAAIYQVMLEFEPDWVIDLHEAQAFERQQPGALGQTIIGPRGAAQPELIEALLERLNHSVAQPGNRFLSLQGLARGSSLDAAFKAGAECLLVETCRQLPLELRVDYQRRAVSILLDLLGVTVY